MYLPRKRRGMRAALALACAFLHAAPSHAGGWPLAPGEMQLILPVTMARADHAFDRLGALRPHSPYRKAESAPYVEYGWSKRVTLIGEAAYMRDETDFYGISFSQRGLSRLAGGARVALGSFRGTLFSIQPKLVYHGMSAGDDPYASKHGDIDTEIGLVAGRNFTLLGFEGFSESSAAYRRKPGNRAGEVKAAVTLGLRPTARSMILVKNDNSVSLQTGSGALSATRAVKLGLSLVHEIGRDVSLEFGGMETVAGQNIVREKSLIAALWLRF